MPNDTRERLGYVLMTALSRRADGWSMTVGAAQDGADAVRRAVEEADRRQLVEALGLHVGTSWGEAVEEAGRLGLAIEKATPRRPVPPVVDLAFALQVAPGLVWQASGHDVFAEVDTGRAIPGDGFATVGRMWVSVVVGGYKLRHNATRDLTVAEAAHVLRRFALRLERSAFDFRRAAGRAILVGMGE